MRRRKIQGLALAALALNSVAVPGMTAPPPLFVPRSSPPHERWVFSDRELRDRVKDRLFDDTLLNSLDVEVDVRDGVVTLSGSVLNREDRRRAEFNAYQAGARLVLNRLEIGV